MKKTDIVPSTDSHFDVVKEFTEYYVRKEHLVQRTEKLMDLGNDVTDLTEQGLILNGTYNILTIKPPIEVTNPIVLSLGKHDVFKIILRKNVVYGIEGNYTKEFVIYIENRKVFCPIITLDESSKEYIINHSYLNNNEFFIAFDTQLSFNPFTLYKNGELLIMYLLSTYSLVSKQPTIKCDIIEAKNALKLHESDIHYLYKPSIIKENSFDNNDYYMMVFNIPDEYQIPNNTIFKFTEYCFGNHWEITWTESHKHINNGYWTGYNIRGRTNARIRSLLKLRPLAGQQYHHGCYGVTDITPIFNWCNEEYIAIHDIVVVDEAKNPKNNSMLIINNN